MLHRLAPSRIRSLSSYYYFLLGQTAARLIDYLAARWI